MKKLGTASYGCTIMVRYTILLPLLMLPSIVGAQSPDTVPLEFQDSSSSRETTVWNQYSVTDFHLGQAALDVVSLFGNIDALRDAAKQAYVEGDGLNLLILYGLLSPIPSDARLGQVNFAGSNYNPKIIYDVAGTTIKVKFESFSNVISFGRLGDVQLKNDFIRLFFTPGKDQEVYGIERFVTFADGASPSSAAFWDALAEKYRFPTASIETVEVFGKPVENVEFGVSYSDISQHIAGCREFVSDVNLNGNDVVVYDLFGVYNLNDLVTMRSAQQSGCDIIVSIAAKLAPEAHQIESFVIRVFGTDIYTASLETNNAHMDDALKDILGELMENGGNEGSIPDL